MKALGNQILLHPDKKPKIIKKIQAYVAPDKVISASVLDINDKCETSLKIGDRIIINPANADQIDQDTVAIHVNDIQLKITDNMAHEPLNDRVLVKEIKKGEVKNEAGLIEVESWTYSEGEIVSVAKGIEGLKPKDVILFKKTSGMKWEDFVILRLGEVELKIDTANKLKIV